MPIYWTWVGVVAEGTESSSDAKAMKGDDGYWRDSHGHALHVSASDLERHGYCPLSWHLSRTGTKGKGEAIEAGLVKHAEIHHNMEGYRLKQIVLTRALIIWSWWFAVIIAFIIDAIAFTILDDQNFLPIDMAKFLALLALVWLIIGIIATYIPWRSWLRITDENTIIKEKLKRYQENMIDSVIEPMSFRGGWFQGGKVEASFMLGAIILGINAIGLSGAENKSQAGFILVGIAMLWTLISSWQLQRVLMADSESELARSYTGLDENTEVAYSDAENDKGLLVDENNGLRGRPDQIVILDGEFIPVEQKTGKVPRKPHYSHKMQIMAYIHLVEVTTGKIPPFGILSYGGDNNHQILWDDYNRKMLADGVKEVQRLMVEGGAKRNHDRPGKCRSCSRRYACPDNLLEVQS